MNKRTAMIALFITGLFSAFARMATAQETTACPSPPKSAKEQRKAAGVWFAKGQALADAEQYTEAVAAFNCSILMVEHPDTLFNAAQAAKLAEDRDAAIGFAERYLVLAPDGAVASEVEEMLAALKSDAENEAASTEPVASPTTETTAETPAPSAPEQPVVEPSTNNIVEARPAEPVDTKQTPAKNPLTVSGYGCLGVGGAGLVVGAVLQGLASKAWSDGKSTDNYGEFREYKDKMGSLETGALVGFIAGGIVAGTGIVLSILGRKEKKEKVRIGINPTGLSVSGRF